MTEANTIPDDPRECCRLAQKLLVADEYDQALHALKSLLELLYAAESDFDDPAVTARVWAIANAQSAMQTIRATDRRVSEIVRHGTGDNREWDARRAGREAAS